MGRLLAVTVGLLLQAICCIICLSWILSAKTAS